MQNILTKFAQAATRPMDYAKQWKRDTGGRVIGILPMHFPAELAHAAGALPIAVQKDEKHITTAQSHGF